MLIGGFNIADDYFGTAEDGAWRDLGLMVEGEAAARLAPYFDELFAWAKTPNARIRTLAAWSTDSARPRAACTGCSAGRLARLSPWARGDLPRHDAGARRRR